MTIRVELSLRDGELHAHVIGGEVEVTLLTPLDHTIRALRVTSDCGCKG